MKSLLLTAVVLMLLIPGYLKAEDQWILKKDSDGIKVYSTANAGENLIVYKGVTEVDAPVEVVIAVIKDLPSYPQWYWQCKEARLLQNDPQKNTYVFYFVSHVGWPVADRDAILYNTQSSNPASGEVTFVLGTIAEDIVPRKEGVVRLKHAAGGWQFKKIDKNRTSVTQLLKTDPGGSVPKALANVFMADTPFNTLKGLKKMVNMDKYYQMAGVPKNPK